MASSDPGIRRVCRLKGHESAVLCCSVMDENILVSGTEVRAGMLASACMTCPHSTRIAQQRAYPYCCQDGAVGLHDLRTRGLMHATSLASPDGPVAVPSVVPHAEHAHSLYACAGSCVHLLDIRQVLHCKQHSLAHSHGIMQLACPIHVRGRSTE